jgi:hypothetical protein
MGGPFPSAESMEETLFSFPELLNALSLYPKRIPLLRRALFLGLPRLTVHL